MSFFRGAINTNIYGGEFVINNSPSRSGGGYKEKEALHDLKLHSAVGAFHNSKERYDPPACLPRTREAVFREIEHWVHEDSSDKPILWLYGPAGAGKSAIAQSLTEKQRELGYHLVASFFFSRVDPRRNTVERLIPSIAYQMISTIPSTRDLVLKAIIEKPNIFDLNLSTQVENLILGPLRAAEVTDSLPLLLVVDGLDECQISSERVLFIEALTRAQHLQSRTHPLFLFCSSRAESDIRTVFNATPTHALSARLVLDDQFTPDSDIETLLDHEFTEIKNSHPLRQDIPNDWPSTSALQELVKKSSGQFIYASTVAKIVSSRKHRPTKRLEAVLNTGSSQDASMFKELDALYRFVLSAVDEEHRGTLVRLLAIMCFSTLPTYTTVIEKMLNLEPGDTLLLIDDLHSLIDVQLGVKAGAAYLKPFHASLCDFLADKFRSDRYHVDTETADADLCLHFFTTLRWRSPSGHRLIPSPFWLTERGLDFAMHKDPTWVRFATKLNDFRNHSSVGPFLSNTIYEKSFSTFSQWLPLQLDSEARRRNTYYFRAPLNEWLRRLYIQSLFKAHAPSLFSDMAFALLKCNGVILDVLLDQELSGTYYINRLRHNSAIFDAICDWAADEGVLCAGILHPPLGILQQHPRVGCCLPCRKRIQLLIEWSDRTPYLDQLLPSLEGQISLIESATVLENKDGLEGIKTAILRYKEKPISEGYDFSFRMERGLTPWNMPYQFTVFT